MASFPGLRTLCTLALCFQSTLSHMQMEEPSPLRDPHGNRDNEPKDFNILTPLRSDGSDFTCKGYQWNTPLTPVATYQAGETYEMTLKGGATHGGGSCQISLSCDNGLHFKVLKSIIGGCPTQKTYDFTIPRTVRSTRCLLGWSWFNRVGNREMYMNCAVVDIVGIGEHKGKEAAELVDRSSAAQAAQAALQILPDMYVANLQGINDCRTKETTEPVFPDPGEDVVYGKGVDSSRLAARDGTGSCIGVGRKSAGDSSSSSSSSPGGSSGNDGQWRGGDTGKKSDQIGNQKPASCNDGQWHPECYGKQVSQSDGGDKMSQPNDEQFQKSGQDQKPATTDNDDEHPKGEKKPTADIDTDDDSSKKGKKPKKPSHRKKKKKRPKRTHFDPDDFAFHHQLMETRNLSEEEEVPTPTLDASFPTETKYWDYPEIQIITDETTTYMVIGGTLTDVPTETGLYDEDGYFIAEALGGEVDKDGFLVTVPLKPTNTIFSEIVPSEAISTNVMHSEVAHSQGIPSADLRGEVPTETGLIEGTTTAPVSGAAESTGPISTEPAESETLTEPSATESEPGKFSILPIETEDAELVRFLDDLVTSGESAGDDLLGYALERQNKTPRPQRDCERIDPVTVYVQPPKSWYGQHIPPPSFKGRPGKDSPSDCKDPKWGCRSCRTPSRCVKINRCTRSCTRLPYQTHFPQLPDDFIHKNPHGKKKKGKWRRPRLHRPRPLPGRPEYSETEDDEAYEYEYEHEGTADEGPEEIPAPKQAPESEADGIELQDPPPPAPEPGPEPELKPKPESASTPDSPPQAAAADPCPTFPIPYAAGDPNAFLPCKPGTFLCKSTTQFYICGQYGGSGWTYNEAALRDVAEGMTCEPKLVQKSVKRDYIATLEINKLEDADGEQVQRQKDAEFEDQQDVSEDVNFDDPLVRTKTCDEHGNCNYNDGDEDSLSACAGGILSP